MRASLVYAVAATIVVACLAVDDFAMHRRVAALERQLAPTSRAAADLKAGPAARTFRASNGVVLSSSDLARLDEEDKRLDRTVAEWEYFMSKQPLPDARARRLDRH